MTAFNVVRFKVKPGNEQQFIAAHHKMRPAFRGFLGGSLVRTGDRTFCFVGEWRTFQSIVKARPEMVGFLDQVRDLLEDLGGGLGVTDPVSGERVAKMPAAKAKKKAARAKTEKARKPAKAKARKRASSR